MFEIVAICLRLPDGRMVMQRRDGNAPTSANMLGFFGGHIEEGETPLQAAVRELGEETSLDTSSLPIRQLAVCDIPSPKDPSHTNVRAYLFLAAISDDVFQVYEGAGAETYLPQDLTMRQDLTPTACYLLEREALL